jgi:hypothetical protein
MLQKLTVIESMNIHFVRGLYIKKTNNKKEAIPVGLDWRIAAMRLR